MLDFLANNTGLLAGGTGAAVVLWVLKKYQTMRYADG